VDSSSTDDSRLRGALPTTDPCGAARQYLYSITSSAGTSSAGGTSTPSVFGRTCYEGLSLKPAVLNPITEHLDIHLRGQEDYISKYRRVPEYFDAVIFRGGKVRRQQ
jgi:hypothetical protein